MYFVEDIDTSTGFIKQTTERYGRFENKEEFIEFLWPWFKEICTHLEGEDEKLYAWGNDGSINGIEHGISLKFIFKNEWFRKTGPYLLMLAPVQTPEEIAAKFCSQNRKYIYDSMKRFYEFGITEPANNPGHMILYSHRDTEKAKVAREFVETIKRLQEVFCVIYGFNFEKQENLNYDI